MKTIIYIRQAVPGGTDNYCKALYRTFCNDAECRAEAIADYPIVKSRLFHYYYKSKPLKEAIRKADIVHVNGYTAMGTIQAIRYAKQLKKKVVYTAHWHPFRCLRHPLMGKLFFNLMLKPFIRKCADVVVTINNEDTRFFQSFHRNVVQIPHWNDNIRQQSQTEKKKNMILFVGRINDPVKGIEHLYRLPAGKYEVHCVGKGELLRKDFIQHTDISDEELHQLYQQASLLVVPSKYEAFSYVALEALLNHTPVLMSENVRIADYLHNVEGCNVFAYGDYDAFVKAVEQSIGTNVETDKVREIFNPQIIKEKYKKVYLG